MTMGLRLNGLLLSINRLEKVDNLFGSHYLDLVNLDLSFNDISSLPEAAFLHLSSLQKLNLSKNSLDGITFMFFHMANLSIIDLSHNRISRLSSAAIAQLNILISKRQQKQQPNLTLDMSGNVFEGSCATSLSLEWVLKHKTIFRNFNEYNCFHGDDETIFKFEKLSSFLSDLKCVCNCKGINYTRYTRIVITTSLIWMLILSMVLIIIFIKREQCCAPPDYQLTPDIEMVNMGVRQTNATEEAS